ncbi:carbon-nitrogen hydrolase family protein [Paenibacillus qinlingensis]|uniref:carbon-nitrogen hydrolase family protein n=1 Tax=Paenibacillus qinlingensis TaxID=1837343 RepID=UPI001562FF8E|nr:carbon-nitrogen hydrolase family protein [Paenibacillus qinlingensis]NQX58044.1 carbon-nitrogen hydrolase family protein [Paenibacillus qinlingensis]
MAKYVTISCLGPKPLVIEAEVPAQEVVGRMIQHWQRQLDQVLPDLPDLIILPEVCDRPDPGKFPREQRLAYYRVRQNQIRDFLASIAKQHSCYITYPAHIEAEDGSWRNAMQLIDREGQVMGAYHKNYLVPDEYSTNNILYGKEAPIFECDFGRVASAICFDLNFEGIRQQYAKVKPDLILFPSMFHGGFMQNYWAYSCRSYFAGAIAGLPCTIVTPLGEVAAQSTNYYSFITTKINLDYAVIHIDENSAHFPKIKQKYGPKVKIHDPGFLGCVLVTSESEDFYVKDIIAEFGLELMDDYFLRAEEARFMPGRIEI